MKVYISIICGIFLLGFVETQDCQSFEFLCDNGRCIPANWICDGENDCGDMSDEPENPEDCPACDDNEFRCNNGRCIYASFVCDGDNDCGDGSDESQNCPPCSSNLFQCKTGACIDPRWVCDGDDDCGDRSDEADENGVCPECPGDFIRCPNGRLCITNSTLCNGFNDCGDWGDESEDACPCGNEEFRCSRPGSDPGPGGRCVPSEWVCDEDEIWDCPLGEDEANCDVRRKNITAKIA